MMHHGARTPSHSLRRQIRMLGVVIVVSVQGFAFARLQPVAAVAAPRIDLRVLVLDGAPSTVSALTSEMTVEGIPFTKVTLSSPSRPLITPTFLASGEHAFYQAVIASDALESTLSGSELTALRTFEAHFGIREVDTDVWPRSSVGMQTAATSGDITSASITAAGLANGFQYLTGPVPFSAGSYTYLAEPLASLPSGETFTTLVTAPKPPSPVPASIIGVYAKGGVEQLVMTSALSFEQPQFKYLGHGILTWATRGIHLGYYRNRMTFHVDDGFADVAQWDSTLNCTPTEDCNLNDPFNGVRMTPADVTYAVQWQAANDYTFTIAFNGFYADLATDDLTQALVANKASFRWLNHGFEHIFQGCVQDFTVSPWRCKTNGQWVSGPEIVAEISQNVALANSLGLSFNSNEYLSGEHSGLVLLPQQPTDNPNFGPALTTTGITAIGADASRESAPRMVGSATTVPRHPTVIYYNAPTIAQEVDEYNFFYGTSLDASGFASTIVPNDAAYDLSFILSNDPRPFYAHSSNMTGDRILYPLVKKILDTYRSVFNANAPLRNLSLTEASRDLSEQAAWATSGMSASPTVSAYLEGGDVTVTNTGNARVPITAPVGSGANGVTLEAYGGELSGWLPATASTVVHVVPHAPTFTSASATSAQAGAPFTFQVTTSSWPTASLTVAPAPPTGVTFTDNGNGTGTLAGTPSAGGVFAFTFTATNSLGAVPQPFVLTVAPANASEPPVPAAVFVGVQPARLLDTRTDPGLSTIDGQFLAGGLRSVGSTLELQVTGRAGVPADVTGVVLNVTATESVQAGFVTVYPCGAAQPTVSNLNTAPGVTSPNAVITKIGAGGKVCLFTSGATHLIADVNGYFPFGSAYAAIQPARLLETRTAAGLSTIDGLFLAGGARSAGSTLELQVTGRVGVPADATAVVLNVTVTEPLGSGFITVYPCGSTPPTVSNLNYTLGLTIPNAVIAKVGAGGKVCLFTNQVTHLVADIGGYFPAGSSFTAIDPARVLETRAGLSTTDGQFNGVGIRSAGSTLELQITGRNGVPSSATAAVLNVTVSEPQLPGFITVYPCGTAVPTVSNLNFVAGQTVPNAVITKIGVGGKVCIFTSQTTHVIADLDGYFPVS